MTLKIITGHAKNLRLALPSSESVARPSSAKLRKALIALIAHNENLQGEYRIGLDLYAGSGAVGLELLSNFTHEMVFVEQDFATFKILQKNCAAIKNSLPSDKQIHAHHADARKLPARLKKGLKFDLIFADPPYADNVESLLCEWVREWLAPNGLLIIQTAPDKIMSPRDFAPPAKAILSRSYGKAALHFFKF